MLVIMNGDYMTALEVNILQAQNERMLQEQQKLLHQCHPFCTSADSMLN